MERNSDLEKILGFNPFVNLEEETQTNNFITQAQAPATTSTTTSIASITVTSMTADATEQIEQINKKRPSEKDKTIIDLTETKKKKEQTDQNELNKLKKQNESQKINMSKKQKNLSEDIDQIGHLNSINSSLPK